MSNQNWESLLKITADLRYGEVARGQIFNNQPQSIKKIGSGDDFMQHLDFSMTSIQKRSYKSELNDQMVRDGEIAFDINTFRGNAEHERISPQVRAIRQDDEDAKDVFAEQNIRSIILHDDDAGYQKERNITNSYKEIPHIESKEECILQANEQQPSKTKNEIQLYDSPRDDIFRTKPIIGLLQDGDTIRQSRGGTQYSKKDNVIKPLGINAKLPTEGQTPMARSITVKKKAPESLNHVWKTQGLFVLFYVRKFIVYLKNISQDNKFRSLKRYQFKIINDLANNYKYYKYGNFLVSMQPTYFERFLFVSRQKIQKSVFLNTRLFNSLNEYLMKNIIIINPESMFKLIWDGFMLFLLVINIFYIPLKIAFEDSGGLKWPKELVFFLNDVPGWAFLMDIILNFNTAYYKKGVVITNRSAIVKYYLKNQFFRDLFVLIPFIISQYFAIKYLDAILLLRFRKILKITNNYLDLLNLRNDQAAICDLIKLIILILFIAHFCGCAFYLVSYVEVQLGFQTNWLNQFMKVENAHTHDWFTNYITSFYWAVITMITVGYGDITPATTQERIFAIVICLLSCGVFAYSVNAIGSIIGALTYKATNFKLKMSLLSIHMKKRGLSTELQMKVKKYFEYLNDEQLEDNQQGENMLKELAGSLKHEIALDIYGKILNSKKIFKLNFSSQFLMDLAPKLKERRLGPEEIIYNEDEQQPKIYFIMKGNVNLFMNVKRSHSQQFTTLQTVSKGGVFGELGFFSGMLSNHGAITTNVVSLVYINIEDFQEIIKLHPIDHEKYTLIKDNYILYSSSRGLGSQCWGCGKFTHQIDHCPLLNYVPNKDQIIQKYRKEDKTQDRRYYKRERYKSTSPWSISDSLKQAVVELIVEREQITDLDDLYARIEEMEMSEDERSDSDDGMQHPSDQEQPHSILKDMTKNTLQVQQPETKPPEKSNDSELLNRIIRRGNRQKTYRKNPHPLQNKSSMGIGSDKQRNLTIIKKQTSDFLQDSIGLGMSFDDTQNLQANSFKEIRSTIKRATFIKKMSTRRTGKDVDEDNIMLYPDADKRKKKNSKPVSRRTLGGNSNLNNLNANKEIPVNTVNQEQLKLEYNINTRLFSKVLELDIPKDYSKYYPKNNPSTVIMKYNKTLKINQKDSSIANNLFSDSNKKKLNYKNIKNNKNSSMIASKYNSILNNPTPISSSNRILKKQIGNINFTNSLEPKIHLKNPSKFRTENNALNEWQDN